MCIDTDENIYNSMISTFLRSVGKVETVFKHYLSLTTLKYLRTTLSNTFLDMTADAKATFEDHSKSSQKFSLAQVVILQDVLQVSGILHCNRDRLNMIHSIQDMQLVDSTVI